eukprot:12362533-Karenia_brevis.AAC.1
MLQRITEGAVPIVEGQLWSSLPINYHQAPIRILAEEVGLTCTAQPAVEDVQLGPIYCPAPIGKLT